jgi:hypothetical protein
MNQLIKEKAGLPRACVGGGGKERNSFLFVECTGAKILFLCWKKWKRLIKKKKEFKLELRIRMFQHQDQK